MEQEEFDKPPQGGLGAVVKNLNRPKRYPPELPRTQVRHEPEPKTCSCGCQLGKYNLKLHMRGDWGENIID